jgi:anti-anti-sigma factor
MATLDPGPLDWSRPAIVRDSCELAEVVHVFGELDMSTADELREAIEGARGIASVVVVDLGQCRYIDSSILHVLANAAKDLGDAFRVALPAGGQLEKLFAITRLNAFVRIAPSVDAALN